MRRRGIGARPLAFAGALLLVRALSAQAELRGDAQPPPAFEYVLRVEPEQPVPGENFRVLVEIRGLTDARLDGSGLPPALSLLGERARPLREAEGGPGSLVELELRCAEPGSHLVSRSVFAGKEGSLVLGPYRVECREPPPEVPSGSGEEARFAWVFPRRPRLFEPFSLALRPLDGSPLPEGTRIEFDPPPGLALEPSGTPGVWAATAFEGSLVELPRAELFSAPARVAGREGATGGLPAAAAPRTAALDSGGALGAAALLGAAFPRKLAVAGLPPEIAATRAYGSLSVELRAPSSFAEDGLLVASLGLLGRGNLPFLRAPRLSARQGGRELPIETLSVPSRSTLRAVDGGYEGRVAFEYRLKPLGRETIELELEPYAVLGPAGLYRLGHAPVRVPLEAEAPRKTRSSPSLAAALEAGGSVPDPALARAAAFLAEGRDLEALAQVAQAARAAASARGPARELARAVAAELGLPEPLLATCPAPGVFLYPAALAGMFGAVAALLVAGVGAASKGAARGRSAGRAGPAGPSRLAPAILGASAALLLALSVAGWAFARREAGREYALLALPRLRAVPSELAEGGPAPGRGASALVAARSRDFVGLRFRDGSLGWAREDEIIRY